MAYFLFISNKRNYACCVCVIREIIHCIYMCSQIKILSPKVKCPFAKNTLYPLLSPFTPYLVFVDDTEVPPEVSTWVSHSAKIVKDNWNTSSSGRISLNQPPLKKRKKENVFFNDTKFNALIPLPPAHHDNAQFSPSPSLPCDATIFLLQLLSFWLHECPQHN